MASTTPLYNLKAVITEVGISPATLRAWERRYGLLKPERTPGGHRLYSRQDIEMLKWLVERQKEGLSISRANEMWHQLKTSEQNISPQISVPSLGETVIDELREQWLNACIAFDDPSANHVLDQAFSISVPEVICTEVLLRGLAQIGERWYAGVVTVQQEHFISSIAARRVNALMAAAVQPTHTGRILAVCPPGEEHDFILLTISYLLRRRGWEVVYLGASVPLDDLDDTVQSTAPVLIISSAQTLSAAASLRKMFETILPRGISLAFGGGIFTHIPDAIHAIPGSYLGDDVANASQVIEQFIATPRPTSLVPVISPEYALALAKFTKKEALIVEFVSATVQTHPISQTHLEFAVSNLTRLIASALELGDINYLSQSIAWLSGLLNHRGIPLAVIREILAIFNLAIEGYLGQDGDIIHKWLIKQLRSGN